MEMDLLDDLGWSKYLTKQFIKADDLGEMKEAEFKVIGKEDILLNVKDGTKTQLCLHIENAGGQYKLGLNQYNANFLLNSKVATGEIVGKTLRLDCRTIVHNPTTKQDVPSIRIKAVL